MENKYLAVTNVCCAHEILHIVSTNTLRLLYVKLYEIRLYYIR
jgi:hypothetical protein